MPDERESTIDVIRHPGSSAVVPLFEKESVVLIHQYRAVIGDFIWEIPAGTMNPGENPLDCAKREPREECGLEGNRFEKLGEILIAPGYSDKRIHIFAASELVPCEQNLDKNELITRKIVPFDHAMEMVRKGEIQDAMKIIGLQMAYPIWNSKK